MCLVCDLYYYAGAHLPVPQKLVDDLVWSIDVMMAIHNSLGERGVELTAEEAMASTILMRVWHKELPVPKEVEGKGYTPEFLLGLSALLGVEPVLPSDATVKDIIARHSKGPRH